MIAVKVGQSALLKFHLGLGIEWNFDFDRQEHFGLWVLALWEGTQYSPRRWQWEAASVLRDEAEVRVRL